VESTENLFKENLPKYHHLKKIRDRLWAEDGNSRVSVMIGSGFSLNANKLDNSLDSMSTWLDVKNEILKELNHTELPNSDNVLDISQSYENEYGRGSLDTLIKQTVPDQNYEPGEIHRKLLKLPWSDVYTTNYDTLLERTLPDIIERNYDVIYDARDIPNSTSPRIVKLHGSFPSNRPFIFTRNDFDSYNETFAPLVNMVQQSIMETTFVLIGFSGEDPNFKTWIRWVQENLGEHMPKIYMLAYDEEESGLHNKGVNLIDFKDLYKENDKGIIYEEMFNDIFQYLGYKEKKDERDWPYINYIKSNSKSSNLLDIFIHNRKSYPGWLVLPDIIKKKNIEVIQLACNELKLLATNIKNDVSKRISVVNEMIWAYDTFQIPIDYHFHKIMKKLVEEKVESDNFLGIENIIIRLIKEARLDYNKKDYNNYVELLKKYDLKKDDMNRLVYEKVLMKTAEFKYSEVETLLDEWSLTNKDFEWRIKKGIIFSKIGKRDKAIKILKNNLITVRKIIAIKNNNYRLLSIEGIILSLLINLKSNTFQNSKERLLILESKLSNPLKELDFMFSRIKPYEDKSGVTTKKGFDPKRITRTIRYSNILNLNLVDSYSMLILYQEFGLRSIGKRNATDAIHTAIKNMERLYPFHSWLMYLQIGEIKKVDDYFTRDVINKTDVESLSLFVRIITEGITKRQNTNIMLEILSRIYFALSKEEKNKIDKMTLELYENRKFHNEIREKSKNIFGSLFRRILFDKNNSEKGIFINEIYKLPIIGDPDGILSEIILDEHHFYDPSFEFISSKVNLNLNVDTLEIKRLLNILKGEKSNIRDASLKRLTFLLDNDSLSNDSVVELRTNLTDIIRREKSGYCNNLFDSYLVLTTNDFELQERYCQDHIQKSIPKSHDNKMGTTLDDDNLNILLKDLSHIFPDIFYKENHFLSITNETYIIWLDKFFEWWDSQEEWLLREKTESLFGKNQDLLLMIRFLKNSFLPNIPNNCLTESDREKFKDIYTKLYKNKYQMALFLIPTLLKIGVLKKSSVDEIYKGLMSNNIDKFNVSVVAIYDLIILESNDEIIIDFSKIKTVILNLFIFRKELTLLKTTELISNIIEKVPGFFNDAEYLSLINSLNVILDEFKNNYYDNSLIYNQTNELLSELANLAGEIYAIGKITYKEELESWKTFTEEYRLPEVRKYGELFE